MEGMELIAFEIISNVGTAKSLAEEKLAEASKYFVNGHHAHASLIQKEASGEKVEPSLIIMHAEDQMMSAETIKFLVEEMIEMYKDLRKEKVSV